MSPTSSTFILIASTLAVSTLSTGSLCAQQRTPQQVVQTAVQTELDADRNDHTAWMYRDHDVTGDHDTLYLVAETPQGSVKIKLEDHGRPLSAAETQQEQKHLQSFLQDPARQAKQKHDSQHDDEQAEQMLRMLPNAFLWTIQTERKDLITLAFRPNPDFQPPSLEARVLSSMAGEIVVSRSQNRIATIRGALTEDVTFGWGMLGRLRKGGFFQVERREIAPHHWQITESHVHMDGRALLFKTIGQQEDEVKTDFRPSLAQTLPEAVAAINEILKP